jgi:hypothetical protein
MTDATISSSGLATAPASRASIASKTGPNAASIIDRAASSARRPDVSSEKPV